MKLSKKGEGRFKVKAVATEMGLVKPSDIEFEPYEFEDCVILTVDDAKRIINSLQRSIKAHEELSRLTNGWVEVSIEENDINMLKERIELTENTNS